MLCSCPKSRSFDSTVGRNATLKLSNFCWCKPQLPFDEVKQAVPALECLVHSDDEVLIDACWGPLYWSDCTNDKNQAAIEAAVCTQARAAPLDIHPHPAFHTVGNSVDRDHI